MILRYFNLPVVVATPAPKVAAEAIPTSLVETLQMQVHLMPSFSPTQTYLSEYFRLHCLMKHLEHFMIFSIYFLMIQIEMIHTKYFFSSQFSCQLTNSTHKQLKISTLFSFSLSFRMKNAINFKLSAADSANQSIVPLRFFFFFVLIFFSQTFLSRNFWEFFITLVLNINFLCIFFFGNFKE